MKKRVLLLFFVTTICAETDGMIKKRSVIRGPAITDIKQSIGINFEKLLTCTSRLIASLSRKIDVLIKKTKQLIAQDGTFFSKAKAQKLELYKKRLSSLCQQFEKQIEEIEKDIALLECDFELS